ncbi:MAG: glycosyl hydrolase family 28 protein [Fimbriimonas sp.]|nr:glycosyl hydrolase family 28 protein [Fimbriimonas sp.]
MLALLAIGLLRASAPIDIRDFGAIADGSTICTKAIQRAIDRAASSRSRFVVVPAGRYLSGTIHMRSHVELRLEKGAVILGSPRRKDYDHGVWYALVMAVDAEDFALTGSGTIDGQGEVVAKDVLHMVQAGEIKIPPKGWRPSETERPEVLEFTRCRHIRVEGVTLKHSTCWVQTYRSCVDLTIRNETVDSKTYWNNDGIDVVDCQKVRIDGCHIDSNDDGICLKSVGPKDICEDVSIDDCDVRSSASAIKFGTSSGGGFRHIRVKDIRVRDTFRSAVALESVDGGVLEDILIEDIRAVHTGNAFFIRLGHRNTKIPPGKVRHVTLRDIDVEVPAGRPDFGYPFHGPQFLEPHNLEPASIVGHRDAPIEDVTLERITIHFAGGGRPSIAFLPVSRLDKIPERPTDYPEFTMFGELPAWGLFTRHVVGLHVRDLHLVLEAKDYRPAIVLDETSRAEFEGTHISGKDPRPRAVSHRSKRIHVGKGLSLSRVK